MRPRVLPRICPTQRPRCGRNVAIGRAQWREQRPTGSSAQLRCHACDEAIPGQRTSSDGHQFEPGRHTFVGLVYLGHQLQVDSGSSARPPPNATLESYAGLMDTNHVAVENRLVALLHKLGAVQPPASLLSGAYRSLTTMLAAEHGAGCDCDYPPLPDQSSERKRYTIWLGIEKSWKPKLKAYAREMRPKNRRPQGQNHGAGE